MIYKTVTRPVVLYASETWTINTEEQTRLTMWQRKVLRRIFGERKEVEIWARRKNKAIEQKGALWRSKYSGSGEGAKAEIARACGKNGRVKNTKNNNDKANWGEEKKRTTKRKVEDGSRKEYRHTKGIKMEKVEKNRNWWRK